MGIRPIGIPRILSESPFGRAVARARALRKRNYVEEFAVRSDSALLGLSERRNWLLPAFALGVLVTAVEWVLAMSFPHIASNILWTGADSNSKVALLAVLVIPFAPPFTAAYSLSHLLFPSPAAPEVARGMMSTFEYRQKSNRRWLIVLVAGGAGALNCLFLIIALNSATGN